jgi:hypothetical protein
MEKKVGMVAAIVIAVACATALILANAAIVSNAMASVEGSTDPVTLVLQDTDDSGAAVYMIPSDEAIKEAAEETSDQALVTYGPRTISALGEGDGKGAKEIVVTERAGSTGGFAVEWSEEKNALVLTAYDENGKVVQIKQVGYNEETGRYEARLGDAGD